MGPYGDAIKIKIQAPAVEGKANEALRAFLAERLDIAPRFIEIIFGGKSTDKLVSVAGLTEEEVRVRLIVT